MRRLLNVPLNRVAWWKIIVLCALIQIGITTGVFMGAPGIGNDWANFKNAASNLRAAYAADTFFYPPHVVVFLPHTLLPREIGAGLNSGIFAFVLIAIVRRYNGNIGGALLAFGNPAAIWGIATSQIDWVPALALLAPPAIAGIAWCAKPQVMLGMALHWLISRRHQPLYYAAAVFTVGFLLFGAWWGADVLPHGYNHGNISLFPFGLVAAMWAGSRAARVEYAVLIAPLIAPYLAVYSLAPIIAVWVGRRPQWAAIATFMLWVLVWQLARRLM